MKRYRKSKLRRGVIMAEAGMVYSIALLLVLGTIIVGLGIFRYQEVAYQARQAARWASVQSSTPTSAQILSDGITTIALDKAGMTASASKTTINTVDYISVTITYRWTPEAFSTLLAPLTFTSTSTQPISP